MLWGLTGENWTVASISTFHQTHINKHISRLLIVVFFFSSLCQCQILSLGTEVLEHGFLNVFYFLKRFYRLRSEFVELFLHIMCQLFSVCVPAIQEDVSVQMDGDFTLCHTYFRGSFTQTLPSVSFTNAWFTSCIWRVLFQLQTRSFTSDRNERKCYCLDLKVVIFGHKNTPISHKTEANTSDYLSKMLCWELTRNTAIYSLVFNSKIQCQLFW